LERAEVLIVGGGPAGSACAAALAAAGRDALVIDVAVFPRDKPCAGWITPEVAAALPMPLDEYGERHVLQPVSRFRIGRIDGGAVDVVLSKRRIRRAPARPSRCTVAPIT